MANATTRDQAKADRRAALLEAAAGLFAERGFSGASLEDLGAAAGVSGPAVYRHFSSKQAVLAALLVGASEGLWAGGQDVVRSAPEPEQALRELIAFHVDFALSNPDVIRVQDRDLDSLPAEDLAAVRTLQRNYIELWVKVLAGIHQGAENADLRIRARAAFGLINSTPHSARTSPRSRVRGLLEEMAWASLR